jgi:hypothetical protein
LLGETIAALAQAGGAAVVQAVGTDVWVAFRRRAAGLFGRGNAQREQDELERLDRTASALGAAGDEEVLRQETSWGARFEMLLEGLDDPEREQVATELRALVAHVEQTQPRGDAVSGNTFRGPVAFQVGSNNRQDNHFGSGA